MLNSANCRLCDSAIRLPETKLSVEYYEVIAT